MFRVFYGSEVIYDPRDSKLALTNMKVELALSETGTFEFSMPTIHPMHGKIELMRKSPEIVLEQDGEVLFKGRATRCEGGFLGDVKYRCEGERGYLNDVTLPPYSTTTPGIPATVDGLFSWYVSQYNAKVPKDQRFLTGINQGGELDPNNYVLRESSERVAVWPEIKEKLLDKLGGYVRVRHDGDLRYIDYLAGGEAAAAQRIEFGQNLLDYTRLQDATRFCTRIVPEGAEVKDAEGAGTGAKLTIADLPDGPLQVGFEKVGEAIVNIEAERIHGVIEQVVAFEDMEVARNLLDRGLRYMVNVAVGDTMELTAVDLHLVDPTVERICLGDYVRARSKPHGFDEYFICTRLTIYPDDPAANKFTLGSEYDTLTGRQSAKLASLNASINKQYEVVKGIDQVAKDAAKKAEAAVVATWDEYAVSESPLEPPVLGWASVTPEWIDGTYIWRRVLTAYGDGTTVEGTPACMTGNAGAEGAPGADGAPGKPGADGVAGAPGADGRTSYFHVKYSPVAVPTSAQISEVPDTYIGTYVDYTQADSSDPKKYAWAKFLGDDGSNGLPGINGEDGRTSYLHIAYALSADGKTGFSVSDSAGKTHIGQCTDFVQADPTDPARYTWSLIKGADGAPGKPGAAGATGAPGATGNGISSITNYYLVSAAASGVTTATAGWSTTPGTTNTTNKYLWNYERIVYTNATSLNSTPSIIGTHGATGATGAAGAPGKPGADGQDGQMLFGACNTGQTVAAKVPASTIAGFSLYVGVTVAIKFTYANTAATPTLNVNGTGAKAILTNGVTAAHWEAGATVTFVYNGTYWCCASAPVYATTATIGNPAGGNVYVDGDSVSVRQGSSILARLKAGVLELAANSANAIIKLCGGQGTIAYYAQTNQLAIMAPTSIALTACQTLPDGTVQPYDAGIACNRYGVLAKGAVEVSGNLTKHSQTVHSGKILYNNASGSNGTIALSESAANFEMLEIYYKSNDGEFCSVKVADPNGKVVNLAVTHPEGGSNGAVYWKSRNIVISGTSIRSDGTKYTQLGMWNGNNVVGSLANHVYITKIVGYR